MTDKTPPAVHVRIGAERRASGSGGVYRHINPITGRPDADIPLAGAAEVNEAVGAAQQAFGTWRSTPPAAKRAMLNQLAGLIEANGEEFARRGTLDNGTPISVAGGFVPQSAEWTRYYAGWADKISSELTAYHGKDGEIGYTLARPFGVIGPGSRDRQRRSRSATRSIPPRCPAR